jgi:hypothetical protein
MATNITALSNENKTVPDIGRLVEYAITDVLLKSLFFNCGSFFKNRRKRLLSIQRELSLGQVIGISAQPDDILSGGVYIVDESCMLIAVFSYVLLNLYIYSCGQQTHVTYHL